MGIMKQDKGKGVTGIYKGEMIMIGCGICVLKEAKTARGKIEWKGDRINEL